MREKSLTYYSSMWVQPNALVEGKGKGSKHFAADTQVFARWPFPP